MKTKAGEQITFKEFLKRWKEGIQNMSPQQKLINESRGTFITLIGFIVGAVALIIYKDKFVSLFAYGLILIFIGNIWTTALKLMGIRQQLKFFKKAEESIGLNELLKGGENV